MLFQSIRGRKSRPSIVIFLIRVLHVVVALQRPSNITRIVAVGTAKRLQKKPQQDNVNEI